MRIGIDATGVYKRITGVENYIINIINGLLLIDKHNHYTIYCNSAIPNQLKYRHDKIVYTSFRIVNRKVFQQTRLPFQIYSDSPDVMFFPGNTLSMVCPSRSVLTVHGSQPFILPKHMMPKSQRLSRPYWKWMSQVGCRKADRVIAVSSATKKEIMEALGIPAEKIHVIHLAGGAEFCEMDRLEARRRLERHCIYERFILCVGTLEYKNLRGAMRAFQQVKAKGHTSLKLVIVGPQSEIAKDIFSLARQLQITDDIRVLNYFPHEEMPILYNAAELLLFPSFYEGFGLPVLEAFACGIPVVASNVASLPEVVGDAGILVDPDNFRAIATEVERVLTDQNLRMTLRRKGHERRQHFCWIQTAKKTLSLLERVGRGD